MLITENHLRILVANLIKEQQLPREDNTSTGNTDNKERILALAKPFSEIFSLGIEEGVNAIDGAMRSMFPDPKTRDAAYIALASVVPPVAAFFAAFFASPTGKVFMSTGAELLQIFSLATAGPFLFYQLLKNLQTVETKLVNLRKMTQNDEPLSKKYIKTSRSQGEYKGFGRNAKDFTYNEFVTILAAQNIERLSEKANYGTGKNISTRLYNNNVIGDEMYKDILKMTLAIREDINNNEKSIGDIKKISSSAAAPYKDLAISYLIGIDPTGLSDHALTLWTKLS